MSRFLKSVVWVLVAALLAATPYADAKKRTTKSSQTSTTTAKTTQKSTATASSVRSERSKTQQEIAATQKLLDENKRRTRVNLEKLNGIEAGIVRQERQIAELEQSLDSISAQIAIVNDSIEQLNLRTDAFRKDVKDALVKMREHRKSVNDLAFVFSAPTFTAAAKRMGYIRDLNQWRMGKISDLRAHLKELEKQNQNLKALEAGRASTLSTLDASRQTLQQRREQQRQAVNDLRKEGKGLNEIIKAKQKRIRELDRELDRIIAAEEAARRKAEKERAEKERREREAAEAKRKAEASKPSQSESKPAKDDSQASTPSKEPNKNQPAKEPSAPARTPVQEGYADSDRAISGSFEANRGRLLFPIAGQYSVVGAFGRTAHHNVSSAQVNNSGIDIAAPIGTKARVVFDGTVSSIFYMPGYENIVIVRHGRYLTVYAGIATLAVKKGQDIKAGATIGTIVTDVDDSSRCMLHFEVRLERDKLNPLEWVR